MKEGNFADPGAAVEAAKGWRQSMIRTLLAATMLAGLPLPASAGAPAPVPPGRPDDCSGLAAARAEAHTASAKRGLLLLDLDGDAARKLQVAQGSKPGHRVDLLPVLTSPTNGRAVELMNDGPRCHSATVRELVATQKTLDAAINLPR